MVNPWLFPAISEIGEQQYFAAQAVSFAFNLCCKSTQVVELQGRFLTEIISLAGSGSQ